MFPGKLVLLLLILFQFVFTAYGQATISQSEVDDLGFIKNLFNDKIYQFARQEADSFLDKYPESALTPEVILIQAQISAIEGDFDLSLRYYNRIISQYPLSPLVEDALYQAGTLKLKLNQKDGLVDLNRLITKFPKSAYLANISYYKGELAFRDKQWKVAEFQFKQILKSEGISDEQRTNTQHYLAWIYYHTGNTLLAKSMFFELLESSISKEAKAKIAFQLGIETQKSKRYKNAITWFERQLSEWSVTEINPQSRFQIAKSHYLIYKENPKQSTTKEKEKAIHLYTENLHSKKPLYPFISRYQRGWLLYSLNQKKAAEQDFSWLQKNSKKYAADLELTATRARYFEDLNNPKAANNVYINTLQYQKKSDIRNMLLVSIIRNSHTLNDCRSIFKWQKQAKLPQTHKDAQEISFYLGSCHFSNKSWKKAGSEFAKISLNTQYARAAFPNYFQVFKNTKDFKGGMAYLDRVGKIPAFGNKEKNLLLKIDLCLTMQRWSRGVDLMLQVKKQSSAKAKDPWYLLNIAKTADQVYFAYYKKKQPMRQYPLKSRKYYANLALNHYLTAYGYLSKKDVETKLSVLDILIARYQALGNYQKLVTFYRDALGLMTDDQRRVELRLAIAKILINNLKQTKQAQAELYKIHNTGNSEAHFEASFLLAEIYVGRKKYIQAIKILEDLAKKPIQKTRWFATTHFRLGELYQVNQRWQKALEHYKSVVADNKNSTLVKQANSKIEKIQKYLN